MILGHIATNEGLLYAENILNKCGGVQWGLMMTASLQRSVKSATIIILYIDR